MNVVHFESPMEFRLWLTDHSATAKECWVGFWRKDSGKGGLTYSDALDEALCQGWIDGVRKKDGPDSYTNRFTPRKPGSHWSRANVERVKALLAQHRMAAPGLAAYGARDPANIGRASFEQGVVTLPPKLEKRFRSKKKAWAFFEKQPPYYRRVAAWWVVRVKREETQLRHLNALIDCSAAGKRLNLLAPRSKPGGTE